MSNIRFICLLSGLIVGAGAFLSSDAGALPSKIYDHLVIKALASPDGAELPPDFAQMLRRNLKIQLGKTNRFRQITVLEPNEPTPPDADLELSGAITRFNKGSKAKRLLPGIGTTRINAVVEFKELPTGQTLYKTAVSGKVVMGVGGGDSLGATNGLAKDVAKIVRKRMQ